MVTDSLRLEGIRWDEIKDSESDRRVPTSNPLCLVTSGVGGFDSLALPLDNL